MITTKKGDKGQTDCRGMRVDKDNFLIEVVGTIDELQAILEMTEVDKKIIDDLYQFMGMIGCDLKIEIKDKVFFLEKNIEKLENNLPKLTKFLDFKKEEALKFNWARTVARRLERRIVSLDKQGNLDSGILEYFNRLSDYLFLMARRAEEE